MSEGLGVGHEAKEPACGVAEPRDTLGGAVGVLWIALGRSAPLFICIEQRGEVVLEAAL